MNFNLGNFVNCSELFYWGSFGEDIMVNIDDVKCCQDQVLVDIDQDGVIDVVDQEFNIFVDVLVDIKGCMLDSDKDGVFDYKDIELYYLLCVGECVNEDGVVVNLIVGFGGGVIEDCVQEMIDELLEKYGFIELKSNVVEWFLLMIYFVVDSYIIKYFDYGILVSIVWMLKFNFDMCLVIVGYMD